MYRFFVKHNNSLLLSLLLTVGMVFTVNSCNKDNNGTEDKLECSSFVPPRGTKNTPVILYGKGFGTDPTAFEVKFNGSIAQVSKCDGNEMIVLTPDEPGASCTISITKGGESVQFSQAFTYIRVAQVCDSFEPLEGLPGTLVTLTGNRFGNDASEVEVKFNNVIAEVVECTDTEIKVRTPAEYPGDDCNITVKTRGVTVQFTQKFTYYAFQLDSFSPDEGGPAVGIMEVTLTGTNFGTSPEDITVMFNDREAAVLSCADTEIKVQLPDDSPGKTCVISVKRGESSFQSYTETFTYIASFDLTTFEPLEGGTGTRITLYGDKFGTKAGDVAVWFNDQPATVLECQNNKIVAVTPDHLDATVVISVDIGLTKAYSDNFTWFSDLHLTSFSPMQGGAGDRITLKGYNMAGTGLAVKFNDQTVNVLSSYSDSIWVSIPVENNFESGDECEITVTKGSQSEVYTDMFTYVVNMFVSTVAGIGTGAFQEGTLTTARFEPKHIVCDNDDNLIVVIQNPHAVILIDQKNNVVKKIIDLPEECHVPCIDPTGRTVWIPGNNGPSGADTNIANSENYQDYYYKVVFDPVKGWTGISGTDGRVNLIRPTAQEIAAGMINFRLRSFHHGYAFSPIDGKVYYKSNQDGGIVKFDPVTNKAEWAQTILPTASGEREPMFMLKNPNQATVPNSGGANGENPRGDGRIAFDPKEAYMLYGTINQTHRIFYLNILTGEEGLYAGTASNQSGSANGYRTDARFNGLYQITFDNDGNMIIAEAGGHRIRKIDRAGMVTTLVGNSAGNSGNVDGMPDVARVNNPRGVAVGKDGTIYIADTGNGRIRKLGF